MPRLPPLRELTVEVDAPAKPGEGKARRLYLTKDKLVDGAEHSSVWALLAQSTQRFPDTRCFGTRPMVDGVAQPYVWRTYAEVFKRVRDFAAGLAHRGVAKGEVVGIYSINRLEWVVADLACQAQGFLCVPLYETLGDEAVEFIVQQSEMKICVVMNSKIKLLSQKAASLVPLKTLVTMDAPTDADKALAQGAGLELVSMADVEKDGVEHPKEPSPGGYKDPVTIMYTSGTTGLPKGAMLSHGNLLAEMAAIEFSKANNLITMASLGDVYLSYLPLAHIMERILMYLALSVGTAIGFFQGDVLKLVDDINELRPTIFASVPRLLNRIYDKVHNAVAAQGGSKAKLFKSACDTKRRNLHNGHLKHWLWDLLVFSKVKARLGGRVRVIVTGSAPLGADVLDFYRYGFACPVHEAYGATESTAAATMTPLNDFVSGHVGVPVPANEIKLVDIPEMNYSSQDKPHPRGEVCIRGPNIFIGYYKDEDKTKETVDEDGWLHTGDVGMWDEHNCLKIIDRKKNIFKLAQGEYIAPEKIEIIYCKSQLVAQAFVHGDSLKAYCVGVIVPDWETLEPWCKAHNIAATTLEEAIKNETVRDSILQDILAVGKANGLKSFEQVKIIHLEHRLFAVENDLLTPTFKLKRPQARTYYKDEIAQMYEAQDVIEAEKMMKEGVAGIAGPSAVSVFNK